MNSEYFWISSFSLASSAYSSASGFRCTLMMVPRPRGSPSVSSLMVKVPSAAEDQTYLAGWAEEECVRRGGMWGGGSWW